MKTEEIAKNNYILSQLLISELVRLGLKDIYVSPGSRNSTLLLEIANSPHLKSHVHFDERGLGFCGVGHSKLSGEPSVLVVTSGTAVANLYPAVIEAAMSQIPLLIISTDRPPELWGLGANQTIDQTKIFGDYVKKYFYMPPPEDNIPWEFYLSQLDEAWALSKTGIGGPVHINLSLREPLISPQRSLVDLPGETLKYWRKNNKPFTTYVEASTEVSHSEINYLREQIEVPEKLIFLVGSINSEAERKALGEFFSQTRGLVYADCLSGLREYVQGKDLWFVHEKVLVRLSQRQDFGAWTVIHLGGRFVSKQIEAVVKACPQGMIRINPTQARQDPSLKIKFQLNCAYHQLSKLFPIIGDSEIEKYLEPSRQLFELQEKVINELSVLSELHVPPTLAKILVEPTLLYVSNSLAIRDMNSYGYRFSPGVKLHGNRGASGIDGLVSSAIGGANASQLPTMLVIGDLSLLHDQNALALASHLKEAFIIIVCNNAGGGIFSFLPVAQVGKGFESHVATQHAWEFEYLAKQFNFSYQKINSALNLIDFIHLGLEKKSKLILELKTNRQKNYEEHVELNRRLDEKLLKD